jgi:DNA replication ATP-dependent helicase Dna2
LGLVGRAGYEWQNEKVGELSSVFGASNVFINQASPTSPPGPVNLLATLPSAQEYQFIVEASYQSDTPTFRNQFGVGTLVDVFGNVVSIGDTRPDIVQVLSSVANETHGFSSGERNLYRMAVSPDGTLHELHETDSRLRLRVIDGNYPGRLRAPMSSAFTAFLGKG